MTEAGIKGVAASARPLALLTQQHPMRCVIAVDAVDAGAADDCVGQRGMVAAADAAGTACGEAQGFVCMLQVVST
jgi:hypothetical protein